MRPREIQRMGAEGKNVAEILRERKGLVRNTDEIIEMVYDFQAGKYSASMQNEENSERKERYTAWIAKTIRSLCEPISILEAGVGEGNTLAGVMKKLYSAWAFGFDISWSQVAFARRWLERERLMAAGLFTASMSHIPLAGDSIDVVYTSHAIEPNGGRERPILEELFRVTREYLILLEPSYELASEEGRRRMERHGYCKNLVGMVSSMGFHIVESYPAPFITNPLNPTVCTIIKKGPALVEIGIGNRARLFVCPEYKTPLKRIGDAYYSPEAFRVYPVIGGIPCLRIENGILAGKYEEIMTKGEERHE